MKEIDKTLKGVSGKPFSVLSFLFFFLSYLEHEDILIDAVRMFHERPLQRTFDDSVIKFSFFFFSEVIYEREKRNILLNR